MRANARTRAVLGILALALSPAACGDDGGGAATANRPKPKAQPKARAKSRGKAGKGEPLAAYPKIDDALRHEFVELDFMPDSSGETNRDPFRSWILRPMVDENDDKEATKEDICKRKGVKWVAEKYSVRDLNLIGLVKRGRSFAQFIHGSDGDSWVVRKEDCIGQEKAVVAEIGLGFVRLAIAPPAPPGAPAPPAQLTDIRLHPAELDATDVVDATGGSEVEEN